MSTFDRRAFVVSRIRRLLGSDPARPSPTAGAQLAHLRRALGKAPGSVPEVWGLTVDGIPDDVRGIAREREEMAIHLALTQFASHQQSRQSAMHTDARSFAGAVRALADRQAAETGVDVHETPAYRRFVALASTSQLTTAITHARGLISQLRSADLAFDYGRYVDDLYWLQIPGQAVRVQRNWGRDFHRMPTHDTALPDEGDDA